MALSATQRLRGARRQATRNRGLSKSKAKTILREGEIGGKALTKKQKGFFGARAAGLPIKRT